MTSHAPSGKHDMEFGRPLQAEHYLKYRPLYPDDFIEDLIKAHVDKARAGAADGKVNAIDLTCGSGQLTCKLLPYFDKVVGVDFSDAQLVNAAKAFPEELKSGKISFLKFDCSKVDELLASSQMKDLNPQFVFIGEGFHWFHCEDFLDRFKRATAGKPIFLVLVSYWTFQLLDVGKEHSDAIYGWVDKVNPFFKFNRKFLDDEYRTLDFTKWFDGVRFQRYYQTINKRKIGHFLGYLSTWSAYRNHLEKHGEEPENDPLMLLSKQLGLEGGKDYEHLAVGPSGGVGEVSYRNRFFAYVLL